MDSKSIQIQAVIFENSKEALYRSLESLGRAIEIGFPDSRRAGDFLIYYGDSSENPVLTDADIAAMKEKNRGRFNIEYSFFGFNAGYSKGHNLLARGCTADYLMIINPDIIVSPRFFMNILAPFDNLPDVGMVEARQTPVEHPKEYDRSTGETEWAAGACVVLHSELFRRLGGFDEAFFMYCEDVDLSWRIRLNGYKIIYQPLSPVYHSKRLDQNGRFVPERMQLRFSAESDLIMAYKWSNPELLTAMLSYFRTSGNDTLLAAAAEFDRKMKHGLLPAPLDPDHKVSRFVNGNYTEHRYLL